MALQVWLPLLGDLTNNGIYNSTISNVNATITNSGKLGKCYTTNGSNAYITGTYTATVNMSFCIWVKFNSSFAGHLIDARVGDVGYQPMYVESNRLQTGGSTGGFPNFYYTFSTGIWYHLCVVYTQNNVSLYVNGSLVGTSTGGKGYDYGSKEFTLCCRHSHNQYYIPADIQDFRIYDHSLSAKEVEILSRGLVVHYPMTGGGRNGDNLLKYTAVNTANQTLLGNSINGAWKNLPLTTIDGFQCYNYPKSYSSTGFYSGQWLTGMLANTTYTYSAWLYFTSDIAFNFTSLGHFQVYNGNSSASDKSHEDIVSARIYEPSSIKANTWTKVRITFTTNNLAGSYFTVYPRYNVGANVGELYFRDCKLELGDHPTPWMPNSIDNEYISMGFNSTTEYDVSGNNYHSIYTSLPNHNSDSARYETSTYFGTTGNPNTSLINTSWLPTLTNGTISWWFKYTTGNSLPFTSDSGTHYIAAGASGTNLYDSNIGASGITMYKDGVVVNTRYEKSGSSDIVRHDNVRYNANEWHHFCLTGINLSTWTDFKINAYGSWHLRGYLSDVRIYATPLTATQVAELYNTSASISNNGTLMGYEFVES